MTKLLFTSVIIFFLSISVHGQKMKWKSLGPFTTPVEAGGGNATGIGRVNCITFHPDYGRSNSTIYAGVPTAGLYISKTNGTQWNKLETDLPLEGVSDVVFDATDKDVIYLASGDRDGVPDRFLPDGSTEFSQSNGVGISRDGGKKWKLSDSRWNNDTSFWKYPSHKNISSIISTEDGTFCSIYHLNFKISGFDSYVFKTTDKGRSWDLVLMTDSVMLREMIAMPGNNRMVFAAGQKAYYSMSSGAPGTWITLGLGDQKYSRIELAASKFENGMIYLLASLEGSGTVHLFSCNEKGEAKLINVYENLYSGEPRFRYVLEASNTSADLYFGNLSVHHISPQRDISMISTWYVHPSSPEYVHADVHGMRCAPDSNVLYVAHDGGISRTRNNGKSWENISEGLDICKIYRISCSQNSEKILAGTQDAGTMLYDPSSSGQNKWKTLRGGDGGACIISSISDSVMVHSDGQNNVLAISKNNGKTWRSITPRGERGDFIKPVLQDPKDPNTIYVGYHDVYRSTDLGTTWKKISEFKHVDAGKKIVAMAVSSYNPDFIYAGYIGPTWGSEEKEIVFATQDGGNSWIDITKGLKGVNYTLLRSLAVDPLKPLTVFAGFGQAWEYRVMKSEDGGKTWINYSEGLSKESGINSLLTHERIIYAATHKGVYYRDLDSGSKWKKLGKGLPNVPVYHLAVQKEKRKISAATNGRGIWILGF